MDCLGRQVISEETLGTICPCMIGYPCRKEWQDSTYFGASRNHIKMSGCRMLRICRGICLHWYLWKTPRRRVMGWELIETSGAKACYHTGSPRCWESRKRSLMESEWNSRIFHVFSERFHSPKNMIFCTPKHGCIPAKSSCPTIICALLHCAFTNLQESAGVVQCRYRRILTRSTHLCIRKREGTWEKEGVGESYSENRILKLWVLFYPLSVKSSSQPTPSEVDGQKEGLHNGIINLMGPHCVVVDSALDHYK